MTIKINMANTMLPQGGSATDIMPPRGDPNPGTMVAFRVANDIQIGGEHYKKLKPEPWDVIGTWGLGYLDGNCVKYIARYREKGGIVDLEKAQHYLAKLIEQERAKT